MEQTHAVPVMTVVHLNIRQQYFFHENTNIRPFKLRAYVQLCMYVCVSIVSTLTLRFHNKTNKYTKR